MTKGHIRADAEERKITRLCHFTPVRNLLHIATGGQGLLSTLELSDDERLCFNQQDLDRFDGHPGHICCSVQYPNAYYLRRKKGEARGEDRIFSNWVCLFIEPRYLWADETKFCPHNASRGKGRFVGAGYEAYQGLFADQVLDYDRTGLARNCTTDAQAEVLVDRRIAYEHISGVAFPTSELASDTFAALNQLKARVDELDVVVAADLFNPTPLTRTIRSGRLPDEVAWHSGQDAPSGDDTARDG